MYTTPISPNISYYSNGALRFDNNDRNSCAADGRDIQQNLQIERFSNVNKFDELYLSKIHRVFIMRKHFNLYKREDKVKPIQNSKSNVFKI